MKKLFTILTFALLSINAFPQFYYTTADIHDVYFADATTGYQCGKTGVIRKTTDGGQTWQLLNPMIFTDFNAACFTNPNYGFICGDYSLLALTQDGGMTWDTIQYNPSISYKAMDITFPTPTTGYLIEENGNLYKSVDAGITWTRIIPQTIDHPSEAGKIFFTDSVTGFVAGGTVTPSLYSTHNGGNTFTFHFQYVDGVTFANHQYGFAYGKNDYHITMDGGNSWSTFPATHTFRDVVLYDQQHGVGVDTGGMIYNTLDGGQTWALVASGVNSQLNAVWMKNLIDYVVVGNDATILNSANSGSNWTIQSEAYDFVNGYSSYYSICFSSDTTVYAFGLYGIGLKSNDAGCTWRKMTFPSTQYTISSSRFFNNDDGIVLAGNHLYTTSNGGATWTDDSLPTSAVDPFKLYMLNTMNGFVLGSFGNLLQTTDGGANWDTVDSHAGTHLNDISFCDANNGYIVGDNGVVLKTTDGGNTWNPLFGAPGGNNTSVYCPHPDTVFVGDNGGDVEKSTDGGSTWTNSYNYSCSGCQVNSMKFINGSVGYIAIGESYYAAIARTDNGGASWFDDYRLAFVQQPNYKSIDCSSDASHVAIASRDGYILVSGGQNSVITGVNSIPSSYQKKILISPNPSTGICSIKLNDVKADFKYDIFNTVGQKVYSSQLKNSESSVNLSFLKKGIYFVRIYEGRNFYTERMVIN